MVHFEGLRMIFRMANSSNRILRKISYKNDWVPNLYKFCSPGPFLNACLGDGLLTIIDVFSHLRTSEIKMRQG